MKGLFRETAMNHDRPQILFAEEAVEWLDFSGQQSAWEALYQRCPWRFPTLGPEYFRLWFRHYAVEWRPLLVVVSGGEGELHLVMPLAVRDGWITGAGAQQAEYQGWLCAQDESPELLQAALLAVDKRLPAHPIKLHYLAPGMPTAMIERLCERNPRMMLTRHSRPLMQLDKEVLAQALRKKGTRSKINRLRRRGELTCRRLVDPGEISKGLDAIIGMYDLRQGAANDSCPFVDDPRKRGFLLDWVNHGASEELHISCLMLDDEVIGAHIGVVSDDACQLAILAYSPRFGAFSPGKLQVYETARILVGEGVGQLDLTPGGDPWKERFASAHDKVFSLMVYPNRLTATRVRLASRIEKLARRILDRIGISPRQIKQAMSLVKGALSRSRPVEPDQDSRRKAEYRLTRFPPLDGIEVGQVHRNTLIDLTRYCPEVNQTGRQTFLQQAMDRLESGQNAYTLMCDDQLAACAWVTYDPANTAIIQDLYCSSAFPDATSRLLAGTLGELKDSGLEAVLIRIPASRVANAQWLSDLGFRATDQPDESSPAVTRDEKA